MDEAVSVRQIGHGSSVHADGDGAGDNLLLNLWSRHGSRLRVTLVRALSIRDTVTDSILLRNLDKYSNL